MPISPTSSPANVDNLLPVWHFGSGATFATRRARGGQSTVQAGHARSPPGSSNQRQRSRDRAATVASCVCAGKIPSVSGHQQRVADCDSSPAPHAAGIATISCDDACPWKCLLTLRPLVANHSSWHPYLETLSPRLRADCCPKPAPEVAGIRAVLRCLAYDQPRRPAPGNQRNSM